MLGKIKKIFAKFLWNYPSVKMTLSLVSCAIGMGFVFLGIVMAVVYKEQILIRLILGLTGTIFFFTMYFLLFISLFWKYELPEYIISEGQKILQKNPGLTQLSFLIDQAKRTEKTDELKEWVEAFENYSYLAQNQPKLQKQLENASQGIYKTEARIKELRRKLNI